METLIFLKKVPLFNSFQLEGLLKLKEITEEISFNDGEIIINENEEGRDAYVIISGTVAVTKKTTAGEKKLATLEKAACFGEMSIVEDEPRSATVRAAGQCELLKIDGVQFRKIILENAELSYNIARVFSARYRSVLNQN